MNDRREELLQQYEIEVNRTRKGRGAILCETDLGTLIFKEYRGNEEKLLIQDRLLKEIAKNSTFQVEQVIPNREGALFVKDTDGTLYILKTWKEGVECNIYNRDECLEAVRELGKLHQVMKLKENQTCRGEDRFCVLAEYEKRNKELHRVQRFLRSKSQKNDFEIRLQGVYDYFYGQAVSIAAEWKDYQQQWEPDSWVEQNDEKQYCHGDFQYHNIIRTEDGFFFLNFEKCIADDGVRDLTLMLRKLLEKSDWDVEYGKKLLESYEKVQSISPKSFVDLYDRLAYPEKFWKIVNFYYNSPKSWISVKNLEKLEKVISQEKQKQFFLKEVFKGVV